MESTQRIYQNFITLGRNRWKFVAHYIDFQLVGASMNNKLFESFEAAQSEIIRLIDSGKIVFINGEGYYVPHRGFSYMKKFEPHNLMFSGYHLNSEECKWFIQDHAQPDFQDYYDGKIVKDFFNLATYSFAKFVSYFEFDEAKMNHPNINMLLYNFSEYFEMYVDDFSMFEKILSSFKQHEEDISKVPGGLQGVEDAFFFLMSSRELFRRFVATIKLEGNLEELLKESISLALAVRGSMVRAKITNKIEIVKLEERYKKLKQIEEQILYVIQKQYLKMTV
jgi:hypothetical protein